MISRAVLLMVATTALAVPAAAQERPMPPVELGGRVGGVGTLVGPIPLYGGGVTVRLSPQFALEGDVLIAPNMKVSVWSGAGGLYQGGVRGRLLGNRNGVEWFWTAGVTGVFAESRLSGDPLRLFGRWEIDLPERHDRLILPPVLPTVGTGAVVPVGARLGVRADVRLLFTPAGPGLQTFVGLSVPVGRFGVNGAGR